MDIPLTEFDPDPRAVIDPSRHTGRATLPWDRQHGARRRLLDLACGAALRL